jgi:hypothetical protein
VVLPLTRPTWHTTARTRSASKPPTASDDEYAVDTGKTLTVAPGPDSILANDATPNAGGEPAGGVCSRTPAPSAS